MSYRSIGHNGRTRPARSPTPSRPYRTGHLTARLGRDANTTPIAGVGAGLLFALVTGLAADPARVTTVTAVAFTVAAAFLVVYWDVRILGGFGYLWFPTAPWNA
jgi:hypothetical protein